MITVWIKYWLKTVLYWITSKRHISRRPSPPCRTEWLYLYIYNSHISCEHFVLFEMVHVRDQFSSNGMERWEPVWVISGSQLSSLSARTSEGFYLTCHNTKAWCKPPSQRRIIASSLYLFVYVRCRLQHQPLSYNSAWLSVIQQEIESDGSGNEFNLVRQIKRWRLLKVIPDLFCDWSTPSEPFFLWCRATCVTSCGASLQNDCTWMSNQHKNMDVHKFPSDNVGPYKSKQMQPRLWNASLALQHSH